MGIVPETRVERIQFYENHLNAWATNAAAIGLTVQEVADLASLIIAARGSYNAAELARTASKNATQVFYDAVRSMHNGPGAGSDIIKKIQNYASSTDDPAVYTLAEIPAPQPPSEAPAPGQPANLSVELLPVGALRLGWTCENPPNTVGTVYELQRSTNGGASFTNIGVSGVRSFIDDTLQSGSFQVQYRITALRSTKRGTTAQFIVQFGVGGASVVSSSSVPKQDMKLAA